MRTLRVAAAATPINNSLPVSALTEKAKPTNCKTGPVLRAMYSEEDFETFRTAEGLCQKACVPEKHLRRAVLKELVDNALDEHDAADLGSDGVECREQRGGAFVVSDEARGLPGTDEEIAAMFSFGRAMRTSKRGHLPRRGRLGNGSRVVAGAAFAGGGGELEVSTVGRTLVLEPREDGTTAVVSRKPCETTGTRVRIKFGADIGEDADDDPMVWAEDAITLAAHDGNRRYKGKPSPHWYDAASFWAQFGASPRSVRGEIAEFDGCSGKRAVEIADGYQNRAASSLTLEEATKLHQVACAHATKVPPERIGRVGRGHIGDAKYQHSTGTASLPRGVRIPYVVEAWAWVDEDEEPGVSLFVNKTPVTTPLASWTTGKGLSRELSYQGCGLSASLKIAKKNVRVVVSVIAPHVPIVDGGKEPDLEAFLEVQAAITRAVELARKSHVGESRKAPQNALILAALTEGCAQASSGGDYRFNLRNLYYVIRALIRVPNLSYGWYSKVIAAYENENGDISDLYRNDRGMIYLPHTGQVISLGTRSVETYVREPYRYGNLLVVEKEGAIDNLRTAGVPEEFDGLVTTSNGQGTKAIKDFIDGHDETDEPIRVFLIHDADGPGTCIYQALQEATAARPERKFEIINLGLEFEEGLALGLEPERLETKRKGDAADEDDDADEHDEKKRAVPVAEYVSLKDRARYQHSRIELNAMLPSAFVAWVREKLRQHGAVKVVPPADVQAGKCREEVRRALYAAALEKRQAEIAAEVDERFAALESSMEARAEGHDAEIRAALEADPKKHWTAVVKDIAADIAKPGETP
jgi:hypothetical protein